MTSRRLPYQTQTEVKPQSLKIEGEIPKWVRGKLTRMGPGRFEFGSSKLIYPGDGMGLFHNFEITDSGVSYHTKFLQSDTYKRNVEEGRICHSEFGTEGDPDPNQGRFARLKAKMTGGGEMSDNCNHNLTYWKENDVILINGSTFIFALDRNLNIKHKLQIPARLPQIQLLAEHMHIDADGTCYMLGSHVKGSPSYSIMSMPPTGDIETSLAQAKVICTVPGQFKVTPCSHHNFIMTENYFVILEMPLEVNIMKVLTKSTILKAIQWEPNVTTKFHIIERKTGQLIRQKYESPSFYYLHESNAFEQDGQLVLDLMVFSRFTVDDLFTPRERHADPKFRESKQWKKFDHIPIRVVLPVDQKLISEKPLGAELVTLADESASAVKMKNSIAVKYRHLITEGYDHLHYPCSNPRFRGNPGYRYFYSTGGGEGDRLPYSVGKIDIVTKEVLEWEAGDHHSPEEPLFLSNPEADGSQEDAGILLVPIIDYTDTHNDRLIFLDPQTMNEVASASMGDVVSEDGTKYQIPEADHGIFISDQLQMVGVAL